MLFRVNDQFSPAPVHVGQNWNGARLGLARQLIANFRNFNIRKRSWIFNFWFKLFAKIKNCTVLVNARTSHASALQFSVSFSTPTCFLSKYEHPMLCCVLLVRCSVSCQRSNLLCVYFNTPYSSMTIATYGMCLPGHIKLKSTLASLTCQLQHLLFTNGSIRFVPILATPDHLQQVSALTPFPC